MIDTFVSLLVWPLRKIMASALDRPRLLAKVSLMISKFPWLFDWLFEFAQRNGILVSAEEDELKQIQSASELTPEALIIFEQLKKAVSDKANSEL